MVFNCSIVITVKLVYSDVLDSASIALKQVDNEYERSKNDKLLISLAHIEYNIASISASLCDLHQYNDVDEIETVIDKWYKAAKNPFNEEDYYHEKKRKSPCGIIYFI